MKHRRKRSSSRRRTRTRARTRSGRFTLLNPRRRTRRRRALRVRHVLLNPRKRRRSRGRSRSRRRSQGGFLAMPGLGGIKEFLSRDMLMTAGGAVGGTALTGLVLRQFGPNKIVKDAAGKDIVMPKAAGEFKLPFTQNADLSVNRAGIAFYSVAIPIAGAVALRRFSRELSNGMALSGLVMGINELISYFQSSTAPAAAAKVAGGGAYLDAPTRRRLAVGMNGAGYDAVNAFGGSIYRSESAFKDNAWS